MWNKSFLSSPMEFQPTGQCFHVFGLSLKASKETQDVAIMSLKRLSLESWVSIIVPECE